MLQSEIKIVELQFHKLQRIIIIYFDCDNYTLTDYTLQLCVINTQLYKPTLLNFTINKMNNKLITQDIAVISNR